MQRMCDGSAMSSSPLKVIAAPDKFRGTVTASEFCEIARSVTSRYAMAFDAAPMADGGEGTLDVIGGTMQYSDVRGPLGKTVSAPWAFNGEVAVIEMAYASGWHALGDSDTDAVGATTYGTGQLIGAAIDAGALQIVVGAGGSVTTDGGLGAIEALEPWLPLQQVELIVATDVMTTFVDAARVFAPQKGASLDQVLQLEARLRNLVTVYKERFGVDVTDVPGGVSAGGLAGGLWAIGAKIVPGFEFLRDMVDLERRIAQADIVVTGEGKLDESSLRGKVVGGVIEIAQKYNKPVTIVVGSVDSAVYNRLNSNITCVSLTERFGSERSLSQPLELIEEVLTELLQPAEV
jgi:glycerate 2-kinase